jgi:hypothetical protein
MRKAGVAPYKRVYKFQSKTNPKFKNVEGLVVTTENQNTPDTYVTFLEELFLRIGADRETHVKKFYEIVLARKQDQTLLESHGPAEPELLPAPAEAVNESQASMAKKYSL